MDELRTISLVRVLESLGHTVWKLRKSGTEHFGRCPIHNAKKNNTSFSFNSEGQFHCFSCGAKGRGAIDLVMALKSLKYQEAVEFLKENFAVPDTPRVQHEPESSPQTKLDDPQENPVFVSTYDKFQVKSSWLEARGLNETTLNHYGVLEYSNPARKSPYNNKIFLPIRRFKDSELVGYLVRNPSPQGDEPKYVFPKGVQKGLEVFGAAGMKPVRYLYLVESPFCVMKFHQLGLPAVSCYGWSVSQAQLGILSQLAKGIIYLPDSNVRDQAMATVLPLLTGRCWVKAPALPVGIDDPEDLSLEQIQFVTLG